MIYIDRQLVPIPDALKRSRVEKYMHELMSFYEDKMSSQQRISFHSNVWLSTKPMLEKLFNKKCAYCESYAQENSVVEHFRPIRSAINYDGRTSTGYWWLAYEWNNLYLVCEVCNRHKKNRFPVNGHRANSPYDDLKVENYLLIDPCNQNDFEDKIFEYDFEGNVISGVERGKVTIETLGLNRSSLKRRRKQVAQRLLSELNIISVTESFDLNMLRDELISNHNEFVDMRNKLVELWLISYKNNGIKNDFEKISKQTVHYENQKIDKKYDIRDSNTSIEKRSYYQSSKIIKQVEIENFKVIKKLVLEFPEPVSDSESWMVVLGENGTGKSTILQAISLALAGEDYVNGLDLNYKKLIRKSRGVSKATVKVVFSGLDDAIELTITKNGISIYPPEPKVLVLGYGSTRMLPNKNDKRSNKLNNASCNVINLFDPYTSLKDVETWLADTRKVNSQSFNQVATAIRELLLLPSTFDDDNSFMFRRRNGRITLSMPGSNESIYDLCDGYKSVLAYALDIMMSVYKRWPSIFDAEGVVLIDEIETHLHPTWKIRIISLLRNVFPNLNFIVTTHDPLCLRGAKKDEVYVLSFDYKSNNVNIENIDIPPGLPLEDLLLGSWFKMQSTLDEDTNQLLDKHRELTMAGGIKDKSAIKSIEEQLTKRMRHTGGSGLFRSYINTLDDVLENSDTELTEEQVKSKITAKLTKKFGKK